MHAQIHVEEVYVWNYRHVRVTPFHFVTFEREEWAFRALKLISTRFWPSIFVFSFLSVFCHNIIRPVRHSSRLRLFLVFFLCRLLSSWVYYACSFPRPSMSIKVHVNHAEMCATEHHRLILIELLFVISTHFLAYRYITSFYLSLLRQINCRFECW